MISEADAKAKWCPDATVQVTELCAFSGEWDDNSSSFLQSSRLFRKYKTQGKVIAIAAVNRNADGTAHTACKCIVDKCVQWRKLVAGTSGFCALYDDNMDIVLAAPPDDAVMTDQWCFKAKPKNATVTEPWTGDISGCTNGLSNANRIDTGELHPASKCLRKDCMAYYAAAADYGICTAGDKGMQRR